jgi:hypothetical protein
VWTTGNAAANTPATNSFWAIDPAAPHVPPYVVDPRTGERKENKKAKFGLIRFVGNDMLGTRNLDRYRTLEGTANDFERSMEEIAEIKKERDRFKKTERGWFDQHGRVIGKLDQLATWLRGLGYHVKAKELEKEVDKQRKTVAKQAASEREAASLASVKQVPTPAKLVDLAKTMPGNPKFHVVESKHARIVCLADHPVEDLVATLEIAERAIEGFQREVVDPYVDDSFPNLIPDGMLHEFWFGPEDLAIHERMLVEYYGHAWGKNKADEMKAEGADFYLPQAPNYLSYRKLVKEVDVPGYVIHEIGHTLMDWHYNAGARTDAQAWLREAVGYWVSLGYLGRNGLVCFSTNEESYAKARQESGVKTSQNGLADVMNQVAIRIGPTLDKLAIKPLWQIDDADFAKSWSFYEFIVRKHGKAGQVWLRQTCKLAAEKPLTFAKDWRPLTESFKPVDGADVFHELDQEWRKYAEREQIARPAAK